LLVGSQKPFPEWERARVAARPEDASQQRLVNLLQQPIDRSETRKQAVRKRELQDLVDRMPQPSASRIRKRLTDPNDALGNFTRYELSGPLRDDLIGRLKTRENVGSRATSDPQQGKQAGPDNRAIGPGTQGFSGLPFLFMPPRIIPWPGITSPQYFPMGFPPAGVMGPVLLVPLPLPPAETRPREKQKPKPPPQPKPPKKKKPEDPHKKPEQKRRKKGPVLPPERRGPGIIDWLSDRLQSSGSVAMMLGGLILVLPGEAVGAALAAATAIFTGGGTAAAAGEAAATEMFRWMLEQKGVVGEVFDFNREISKRFPGLDLIDQTRPWQVKMWGVNDKRGAYDVANSIANEMVKLFDEHPSVRLPTTTARELLKAEDLITKRGAWPKSWPHNPSIDQLKVLLRDTGFGVPDDLISATRSAFGKKLLENTRLRELIPDVALGSTANITSLTSAEQAAWGARVSKFLFSHVVGVGATTEQLRTMTAAAKVVVNSSIAEP
jgi:hypothetical protein